MLFELKSSPSTRIYLVFSWFSIRVFSLSNRFMSLSSQPHTWFSWSWWFVAINWSLGRTHFVYSYGMPSPVRSARLRIISSGTVFKSYAQPGSNRMHASGAKLNRYNDFLTDFREHLNEATGPIETIKTQLCRFIIPGKNMMVIMPTFAHTHHTHIAIICRRDAPVKWIQWNYVLQ